MSAFTRGDFDELSARLGDWQEHHTGRRWATLRASNAARALDVAYLERAHAEALRIAQELGISEPYLPALESSGLRVNTYPVGVGFKQHVDSSIFTVLLYRDRFDTLIGTTAHDALSPGLHMGQLAELIEPTWPEEFHGVRPADSEQCSIVYFACPAYDVVLRTGVTVREWGL